MHRHYKAGAAVAWSAALLLFIVGAFEDASTTHYNLYIFAVFAALVAGTFTCLAALEEVISRVFAREAALSREALATAVAAALADELEERNRRNGGGSLHQIHP